MNENLFFKDNLNELKDLLKNNKPFVLFLGAGINADFSHLMWNDLLNGLMESTLAILVLEEGLSADEKEVVKDLLFEKKRKIFGILQSIID